VIHDDESKISENYGKLLSKFASTQWGHLQRKGPRRLRASEALHRSCTKARFHRLGLLSVEKLVSA
jgi:hypothetical protein